MNFFIFRHGETYNTKHGIMYDEKSVVEADILNEAKPVIQNIANFLKNKSVEYSVSSPVKRCRQTAEIIEKATDLKFTFDERLTEFFDESVEHMVERLNKFIKEVKNKDYKSVAICSHGEPVSALIGLLTKEDFTKDDLHDFPKTGVVALVKNGKVEYRDFNQFSSSDGIST